MINKVGRTHVERSWKAGHGPHCGAKAEEEQREETSLKKDLVLYFNQPCDVLSRPRSRTEKAMLLSNGPPGHCPS